MAYETLDFCYDLIEYLDSNGIMHVSIFLQREENTNKASVFHSDLKELKMAEIKDLLNIIANIIKPGILKSRKRKLQRLEKILVNQNIEYVVALIDIENSDLQLSYSIKDNESIDFFVKSLSAVYQNSRNKK